MALDFPDNPAIGQTFERWVYDGSKWVMGGGDIPQYRLLVQGSNGNLITTAVKPIDWHETLVADGLSIDGGGTVTVPPDGGGLYAWGMNLSLWENVAWGGEGRLDAGLVIDGAPFRNRTAWDQRVWMPETITRWTGGGVVHLGGGSTVYSACTLNSGSQPTLVGNADESYWALHRLSAF